MNTQYYASPTITTYDVLMTDSIRANEKRDVAMANIHAPNLTPTWNNLLLWNSAEVLNK